MDLIKCLIKNLRVAEDPTATRLIKFTKANETSDFLISPEIPSIASGTNEFRICLSPVIVPDICENAIQTVGVFIHDNLFNLSWRISNIITDEVLVEGDITENYKEDAVYNIIDKINNSNLNIKARYIYDNGSPFAITNISEEPIKIRFELNNSSEDFFDVSQYFNEWSGINENESYTQVTQTSFEVCLSASPCVAEVKTLTLKKPTADLRKHSLVIKYLIESSGFTETLTDTLVYSNDYRDPTSTIYNVDYAETVCDYIRSKFEQYSNITFENSQPENVIIPVNNCIDNRGDVQFELKLRGLNTSINTIDLIMTEDRGATLIKVSTPANADKNAALNSLASQLVAHGYTSVAPANNERITLKKSDVRALSVITSGYTSHSFSVDGADWGYDGNFSVEGVYRDNVAVRPMSCTLGLKDPYRNFENYTLTFKGYPLTGGGPINYTKVTILPVDSEDLEENQLDFLTTLTDLDSFSFETCEINISGPA